MEAALLVLLTVTAVLGAGGLEKEGTTWRDGNGRREGGGVQRPVSVSCKIVLRYFGYTRGW